MKVSFQTLGCKVNQAETELLARRFTEAGHRLVSSISKADVCIINTCTVTHVADAKARHLINMVHRRNPDATIVVTGCYAQNSPHELAQLEGVDIIVGNDEKHNLLRVIGESGHLNWQAWIPESVSTGPGNALRTRTMVNIQDGCTSGCTYCIVPLVRGREKSLPVEQVIAEVAHRVTKGSKEVVLTGTKVGSYFDNGTDLKGLLELIFSQTRITRLRLSSLQPCEINHEFLQLWQDDRLCPHLHLSLQSGSDSVLRRMKRGYNTGDYQETVAMIKRVVPDAAITTDIIVGFPGESDDEFEESYQFCRQTGFSRVHVFPYSLRNGTEAARLPGQIDNGVKKQRGQRMLALAATSTNSYNRQFLGRIMPVLWEKQSTSGIWSGLTDNYIRIYTNNERDLTNELVPTKLVESSKGGVWGEVC